MLNRALERNRFEIDLLSADEWRALSADAHLICFNERRSATLDRIDFALIVKDESGPVGYCTCRELDSESVYWQFGGAFPGTHSSAKAVSAYEELVEWTLAKYKRITTLVENENVRYLKLAMHAGFRIIGCRFFKGDVLVELLNERKNES